MSFFFRNDDQERKRRLLAGTTQPRNPLPDDDDEFDEEDEKEEGDEEEEEGGEEEEQSDDAARAEVELLRIVREIDHHREQLKGRQMRLEFLCGRYPLLRHRFEEFTRMGGVDADDLVCFLNGKFRYRRTRSKRHLRLISNGTPRIKSKRLLVNKEPDDAA